MAFKGFQWREFSLALRGVHVWILLGALAVYLTSYFFRGLRWHLMLKSVRSIPVGRVCRFVVIGFMLNNIIPARLGEFARALVIADKEKISARASFASIVLERVFDGFTIVLLLLILMIKQPFPFWVRQMVIIAGALFILVFIFLLILGHKGEKFIDYLQKRFKSGIINKVAGFARKFVSGLEMLKDKSIVLWVFLLSLVVWSIEVLNYLIVMRALDISLPITAAAFTLVVTNLGIMIPSSPGSVGTFQYFCLLGLSIYKIEQETALAFAVILHAAMYISITLLGILFLTQMGLSLGNLKLASRSVEEDEDI